MKKFALAGLLVIALLLVTSAWAWGGYIFQDPQIKIGDRTVNVLVAMDVPEGAVVSRPSHLVAHVPRNVPAEVIDPFGWRVQVVPAPPQRGPSIVSILMVHVSRADRGMSYPVQVTVFDDAGFSVTVNGRAGELIVVPYIQTP
ncbi:MAG: hypothetical protein ACP5TV_13095 [Anaerolineae bacterium]